MKDDELSAGVLAYLQKGQAASPRADEAACASLASARDPSVLVAEVQALVQESINIPIDWDGMSLGDAGRHVAAEMANRPPSSPRTRRRPSRGTSRSRGADVGPRRMRADREIEAVIGALIGSDLPRDLETVRLPASVDLQGDHWDDLRVPAVGP